MASSYSTDLKLELMASGENSGTWGNKTNTNLNLVQQAIAGFQSIAITSTNTTLLMTDATISDARNAVIKFTGTLSANSTVFVQSGIEKTYTLENATSGAFTLAFNQVGGSSVIWSTTDKGIKQIYLDGTNPNDINNNLSKINLLNRNELRFGDADNSNYVSLKAPATIASNISFILPGDDGTPNQFIQTNGSGGLSFATAVTGPGGSTTQVQYNNSNAFAGSSTMTFDGTNLQLNNQADLRFGDTSTNYVALQAPATVTTNTVFSLPTADGSNGKFLATQGNTNLTFISLTGGLISQVLSTSSNLMFSTNSASYVSFSALKLTITPTSASSRIYINWATQNIFGAGDDDITIFRNSTDLNSGTTMIRGPSSITERYLLQFIDSPSTTSATEYTIRAKTSGTLNLNNTAQGEGVTVLSLWDIGD